MASSSYTLQNPHGGSLKHMMCNDWARGACQYTEADCGYAHEWKRLASSDHYSPQDARNAPVSAAHAIHQLSHVNTAAGPAGQNTTPAVHQTPAARTGYGLVGPGYPDLVPAPYFAYLPTSTSTGSGPARQGSSHATHQNAFTGAACGPGGPGFPDLFPVPYGTYLPTSSMTGSGSYGQSFGYGMNQTAFRRAAYGPVSSDFRDLIPVPRALHQPVSTSTEFGSTGQGFSNAMHQNAYTMAGYTAGPQLLAFAPVHRAIDQIGHVSTGPGSVGPSFPASVRVHGATHQPVSTSTAPGHPILESPTNLAETEVKDKSSHIFETEPPELWRMVADMRKFVGSKQSGHQSGRVNTGSFQEEWETKLTEYATYMERLAMAMEEASVALPQSEKGKSKLR